MSELTLTCSNPHPHATLIKIPLIPMSCFRLFSFLCQEGRPFPPPPSPSHFRLTHCVTAPLAHFLPCSYSTYVIVMHHNLSCPIQRTRIESAQCIHPNLVWYFDGPNITKANNPFPLPNSLAMEYESSTDQFTDQLNDGRLGQLNAPLYCTIEVGDNSQDLDRTKLVPDFSAGCSSQSHRSVLTCLI